MDLSFRDWAGIPAHIVDLMVTKLDRFCDYIRFSGVCPEWRYVALNAYVDPKSKLDALKASRNKLPMLMFKMDENNDELRSLYNVSNMKTYTIKLPIPYTYRFVGSSLGWLFCVEENMVVTLVNPFNNMCISLPVFEEPRKMFRHWDRAYLDDYIQRGILLSDPQVTRDSFVVVVLYAGIGKLAFFKSNELSWNFIELRLHLCDIIYYKDKLYGVSHYGQFVQIDLDSRTIKTIIRAPKEPSANLVYLVESQDGELLMVKRFWLAYEDVWVGEVFNVEDDDNKYNCTSPLCYPDDENVSYDSETDLSKPDLDNDHDEIPEQSYDFKVFKLTHSVEGESSPTWVQINNIGEQTLFVGDNHSISVKSTDFLGCKPNSIYYTAQHHYYISPYICYGLEEDSGIFSLEDGEFDVYNTCDSSHKYKYPPIWFVPTLQEIK